MVGANLGGGGVVEVAAVVEVGAVVEGESVVEGPTAVQKATAVQRNCGGAESDVRGQILHRGPVPAPALPSATKFQPCSNPHHSLLALARGQAGRRPC